MLLKRQQVLLGFLDLLEPAVRQTDFQKLLLAFTREYETIPSYDFVPYHYGGFSFTSYADRRKLIEKGLLEPDEHCWRLTAEGRRQARKVARDSARMTAFVCRYSMLRGNALIVDQYRRYPYYASRSELLDKLPLEVDDLTRIAKARPKRHPAGLVTIGYEGRSLENYLNAVLKDGVTVLCDVRRNALSRKYGFSKGTLGKACSGVSIRYEHLPELGIPSEARRNLATQSDYDDLFAEYENESLPGQLQALKKIAGWISAGDRVALTCYERLPEQCHRHCVAGALEQMGAAVEGVKHL